MGRGRGAGSAATAVARKTSATTTTKEPGRKPGRPKKSPAEINRRAESDPAYRRRVYRREGQVYRSYTKKIWDPKGGKDGRGEWKTEKVGYWRDKIKRPANATTRTARTNYERGGGKNTTNRPDRTNSATYRRWQRDRAAQRRFDAQVRRNPEKYFETRQVGPFTTRDARAGAPSAPRPRTTRSAVDRTLRRADAARREGQRLRSNMTRRNTYASNRSPAANAQRRAREQSRRARAGVDKRNKIITGGNKVRQQLVGYYPKAPGGSTAIPRSLKANEVPLNIPRRTRTSKDWEDRSSGGNQPPRRRRPRRLP